MENRDPGVPVLRPPRSLRALAWAGAALAVALGVLAAVLLLTGVIIPGCCFGIATGVLAVLATPPLSGRTEVRDDALVTRADPAKTYTLPWPEISEVVTRRRLLTEVVAVRRGDVWLELGGPRRWRFRADAGFTAAADDLARRARVTVERGGRRTSAGKLAVRAALAAVYVVAFVTLDPVWHSPSWPGRMEATSVPDGCAVIASAGGHPPVKRRLRMPDDDICANDGTLSVRSTLYTYAVGHDGGVEQAESRFRAAAADVAGGTRRAVPGLGDEAVAIVPSGAGPVKVLARRANVVVQVAYRPRTGTPAAATATAQRLARTAVDRVRLR